MKLDRFGVLLVTVSIAGLASHVTASEGTHPNLGPEGGLADRSLQTATPGPGHCIQDLESNGWECDLEIESVTGDGIPESIGFWPLNWPSGTSCSHEAASYIWVVDDPAGSLNLLEAAVLTGATATMRLEPHGDPQNGQCKATGLVLHEPPSASPGSSNPRCLSDETEEGHDYWKCYAEPEDIEVDATLLQVRFKLDVPWRDAQVGDVCATDTDTVTYRRANRPPADQVQNVLATAQALFVAKALDRFVEVTGAPSTDEDAECVAYSIVLH